MDSSGQSNQEFFQFGPLNVDQFDADAMRREQTQNANNPSGEASDFSNYPQFQSHFPVMSKLSPLL